MSIALQRSTTTLIYSSSRRLHHHVASFSSVQLPLILQRPIKRSEKPIINLGEHRPISTTPSLYKSAMPLSIDDESEFDDTTDSRSTMNSTPFLLADIGEGISEVELMQWFVKPGDTVAQFDRICEVQSDKAAVEITSRFDGTIEVLCGNVGDMMFVGKPLLYIATAGGGGGSSSVVPPAVEVQPVDIITSNNMNEKNELNVNIPYEAAADEAATITPTNQNDANGVKVLTSPAVRKLSKEHDIDLSSIVGSGPKGRVLKADVLKLINMNSGGDDTTKKPKISTPIMESDTVVPIRGYSRLMVKSMNLSLQVPHMVYADEINVNALTEVRDALRPLAKDLGVPKLTYLPFFIKASSLALNQYPVLNSTIDVDEMTLTYHAGHRIGVAVDTDRGLAVPVVKNCQDMSVLEIAIEMNRLYSSVRRLRI